MTVVSRRRVKITRLILPLDFATLVAQDDFALSGERSLRTSGLTLLQG